MPRGTKVTVEQIIGKLRDAEVGVAQGKTVPEVVRKLGVTGQTYDRWTREYGGLRTDQAKRLKDLEKENARLKRRLADDEPQLVKRIVWMASEYGRYGYRRIAALLRAEGWWINHERVERIWRQGASKCLRNSQSDAGSGLGMDRASDDVRPTGTMSGATTS